MMTVTVSLAVCTCIAMTMTVVMGRMGRSRTFAIASDNGIWKPRT